MEAKSVVDIKRLEEQLTSARETAKTAFLSTVNETLEQLRQIGFAYELVAVGMPAEIKPRVCGNCGEANHSARTCPKKGAA